MNAYHFFDFGIYVIRRITLNNGYNRNNVAVIYTDVYTKMLDKMISIIALFPVLKIYDFDYHVHFYKLGKQNKAA